MYFGSYDLAGTLQEFWLYYIPTKKLAQIQNLEFLNENSFIEI